MPLDQSDRALLQLFLEGGQDYSQAAALLELDRTEISTRAHASLSRLTSPPSELPRSVCDWLLGQSDPISEADAISSLRSDPALRRTAVAVSSGLKLVFPGASVPDVPPAESLTDPAGERSAPPAPSGAAGTVTGPEPSSQTMVPDQTSGATAKSSGSYRVASGELSGESISSRIAGLVGGATASIRRNPRSSILVAAVCTLAIAVVLGITLLGGKDGEAGGSDGGGTATLVPLEPTTADTKARGRAVVVAANGAAIAQINVAGLEPTAPGESYVLWLYRDPDQAYPLARDVVGETGKLTGPAPVPRGLDPPYESYGCLELTLARRAQIERGLRVVARSGTGPAIGTSVLRGEISPAERDPRSGSASVCDPDQRGA